MGIYDIETLVANLLPSALETISMLLGIDAVISNKSPVDEPVSDVYGVYAGDYVPETVPDSTTIPETENRECRIILTDGYSFVTSSSLDMGTIEPNYCYVRYDIPIYVGEIITIKRKLQEVTENIERGITDTDTITNPSTKFEPDEGSVVVTVSQGSTTYTQGVDYMLMTQGIKWLQDSASDEPVSGSTYNVQYQLMRIRKFEVIGQESLGMTQTIINRYVLSSLGD